MTAGSLGFRHQLLLIVVSATVFLTNLGGPPLMDRDEPRNAGCAAEMAARGDWVVPWFNDELREHKPVLLYWLMMSAYAVFGVNEFAARFWSAALAVGTVLMTYHIGRRLFNPAAACWSAVVLATAFMFVVSARIATPDSVLIFCGTLSLLVFVYGTFRPRSADVPDAPPELRLPGEYYPHRRWVVVGMFAAMGLGVLAKGPIGVLLPTAIVGMFLLIMRLPVTDDASAMDGTRPQLWWVRGGALLRPFAPRHFLGTCASMRPLTAVLTVLIVALPWYVWVGLRTDGDWLRGFFGEHNLSRALSVKEGHDGSLLYYPVAILIGFFPWSVFLLPILLATGKRIRCRDPWTIGYVLAACWVGVYLGVFSLAQTKLPSYITPAYPGLALLAGCFIYQWNRGSTLVSDVWPFFSLACLFLAGGCIAIGLYVAAKDFLPGSEWICVAGGVPMVGAAAAAGLVWRDRNYAATVTLAGSSALFATLLFGFCLLATDRYQRYEQLLTAIDQQSSEPVVGSLDYLEPSWIFYGGHPVWELRRRPELEGKTVFDVERQRRFRPWEHKPRLDVITFLATRPEAYVITTQSRLDQIQHELPADIEVLAAAPYFLKRRELVVIGRKSSTAVTVADAVDADRRR